MHSGGSAGAPKHGGPILLFVKVTEDGIIELTGPVEKITEGSYQFK